MRSYKTMQKTYDENTCVIVRCDLCGAEAPNPGWWDNPWTYGYGVERVNISYESGDSFPEGRFTKTMFVDVCPDCFVSKVIPWLKSQGATISEKDSYI